jgi:hypothetical protein
MEDPADSGFPPRQAAVGKISTAQRRRAARARNCLKRKEQIPQARHLLLPAFGP